MLREVIGNDYERNTEGSFLPCIIVCLVYYALTAYKALRLYTEENAKVSWAVWGLRQAAMVAIWVLMFVAPGKEVNYGFFALTTMIYHFCFELYMSPWSQACLSDKSCLIRNAKVTEIELARPQKQEETKIEDFESKDVVPKVVPSPARPRSPEAGRAKVDQKKLNLM